MNENQGVEPEISLNCPECKTRFDVKSFYKVFQSYLKLTNNKLIKKAEPETKGRDRKYTTEQIKMVLNKEKPEKSLSRELQTSITNITKLRYQWKKSHSYLIKKKSTKLFKENPASKGANKYIIQSAEK